MENNVVTQPIGAGKRTGGIDPGKDGVLAVIDERGEVTFHDVPMIEVEMSKKTKAGNTRHKRVYDIPSMIALLRAARLDSVAIEKVHVIPGGPGHRIKMGAVSAFSSGEGWGIWQALLVALEIPHRFVSAVTWKARLMHGEPKTKEAVVPFACRLYPRARHMLYGARGGLLVDRADALLIAHYGRAGF